MKIYRVIGLMSGTSLDGIDAAIIETDGKDYIKRVDFMTEPYEDGLREKIRRCFSFPSPHHPESVAVEKELTEVHADITRRLMERNNLSAKDVDLIGFHGQTIFHAPDKGFTCQLGDGPLLAEMTGVEVVTDFRVSDVKAGGQGAPLVPIYHKALSTELEHPVAFLNVGGVANVTYVGTDGKLIAFDTGPGNALIDDWVLRKDKKKFDDEGMIAAKGQVSHAILASMLSHEYFDKPPPKSIDRNTFLSDAWKNLSLEDGAATLTAFTAGAVGRAVEHLPEKPRQWIVSGGGRLNKTLMRDLENALGVPVRNIDELKLNGDAIEAEAFGYLAVRSKLGLPISFPETTGVPYEMSGGTLNPRPPAL